MYNATSRKILLDTAHDAIYYAIAYGKNMPLDPTQYAIELQAIKGCFVTLYLKDDLRSCMGTLNAFQPLILDVNENAYNAAFNDPRFMPVTNKQAKQLQIEISVLNPQEDIHFSSEANLLAQLRPQIDGLILTDKQYKGTLLPTTWRQFPDPFIFFSHLKIKAGLPTNYWSDTIRVQRYTTELIS